MNNGCSAACKAVPSGKLVRFQPGAHLTKFKYGNIIVKQMKNLIAKMNTEITSEARKMVGFFGHTLSTSKHLHNPQSGNITTISLDCNKSFVNLENLIQNLNLKQLSPQPCN